MTEINYEEDLAIDPDQLDEEWLMQPQLYFKYSKILAIAVKEKRKLEEKKKTIRAELIKAAGENPKECLGENIKPTVLNIESYYQNHEKYKQINSDLIEKEYEVSLLENAVWAFGHRKTALENAVKLLIAQYFAPPKEPRQLPGGKRMTDIARDKVSQNVRKKHNENRRSRRTV